MTERLVKRERHKLNAQHWTLIIDIVDAPAPGEAYLTLSEIQAEFEKSLDLPAGISYEFGSLTLQKSDGQHG